MIVMGEDVNVPSGSITIEWDGTKTRVTVRGAGLPIDTDGVGFDLRRLQEVVVNGVCVFDDIRWGENNKRRK